MEEFRISLELLRSIDAPLKLVIAGNHDFTLDTPSFKKIAADAKRRLLVEPGLMEKTYGDFDEARQLFSDAKVSNIIFLDQAPLHH